MQETGHAGSSPVAGAGFAFIAMDGSNVALARGVGVKFTFSSGRQQNCVLPNSLHKRETLPRIELLGAREP